jgi:hypothetical protein
MVIVDKLHSMDLKKAKNQTCSLTGTYTSYELREVKSVKSFSTFGTAHLAPFVIRDSSDEMSTFS